MPSRNTIQIEINAEDNASGPLGDVGSALGGVGKFAAAGAAALLGATVAIGGGLLVMARDAAPMQGISNAFKALAASAGQNSDKLLASMTKASMGMVDDTELMKAYNSSAQLVGTTLAGQLPDAYQYLAKVAASSGQDVGQLMDTLVNGIGRVTPKMLTQLGVVIDTKVANEAYAASIGKSVDQLTKSDKQTALFNATMTALKKNTAAMPDVTQNASTKMAQWNVKLADMKEHLGLSLLPMLGSFMDLMSKLADQILPIITPIIEDIGNGFATFFQALSDGVNPLTALGDGLYKVFGEGARPILDFVTNFGSLLGQLFSNVGAWVNGEALPALSRFGAFFTTDVLPVVVSFIQSTVIPGIQTLFTFLSNAWQVVAPALNSLFVWFTQTALPAVLNFINTSIIPGIGTFTDTISKIWQTVSPALQSLWLWFTQNGLPFILQALADFRANYIQPVIEKLGEIWSSVKPKFDDLGKTFGEAMDSAQKLVTLGLAVVLDTLDKAAISAGFLAGIIEIFLVTTLQNAGTAAQNLVNIVIDWINKNADLLKHLGNLGASLLLAIGILKIYQIGVAAAALASGAGAGLAGAIAAASSAAWASLVAFAAPLIPIAALTLAIFALIEAYQLLQKTMDYLKKGGQDVVNAAAPQIASGALSHDAFMAKAFNAAVAQFGDLGARLWWDQGYGRVISEGLWQKSVGQAAASRDSGGSGRAGSAYMIGRGAQPEMFIPSTNGTFVPNADKMMGGNSLVIQSLVVNASGTAEGTAAGHGVTTVLDEWVSRGNR